MRNRVVKIVKQVDGLRHTDEWGRADEIAPSTLCEIRQIPKGKRKNVD